MEKKKHSYFYFANPLKEKDYSADPSKICFEFEINKKKIRLYKDDEGFVEILRIDAGYEKEEIEANQIKSFIQSILKLSYARDFSFSPLIFRANYEDESEIEEGVRLKLFWGKKEKPQFNKDTAKKMFHFFREKPNQLILLANNLDIKTNHIERYTNLYKIIEFEYHFSNMRNAKEILKGNGGFREIVSKYSYKDKSVDELIEYLVELRDKCSHFKKKEEGTPYGFSSSNIEHQRELSSFLPTMIKICAKVISPGFEITQN